MPKVIKRLMFKITKPVRRYYWNKVVSVLLKECHDGVISPPQLHSLASHFDVTQEK